MQVSKEAAKVAREAASLEHLQKAVCDLEAQLRTKQLEHGYEV